MMILNHLLWFILTGYLEHQYLVCYYSCPAKCHYPAECIWLGVLLVMTVISSSIKLSFLIPVTISTYYFPSISITVTVIVRHKWLLLFQLFKIWNAPFDICYILYWNQAKNQSISQEYFQQEPGALLIFPSNHRLSRVLISMCTRISIKIMDDDTPVYLNICHNLQKYLRTHYWLIISHGVI